MAQHDPKTLGADNDGDDLLVDIKRRADIFLTLNSGPTEPSYKQTGTPWLKTGGTAWPLNVWDGAQWIALGVFDTASNIFRTAVDADLDSYIGATGTDDEIEVVIGGTLRALFTGESLRLDVPLSFGSATTHMRLPSATTTGFATATDEGDMALDSTLNRPVVRVGGAVKRLAFTDDSAPSVRILQADDFSGPGTPGLPLQISTGGTAVIADTINAGGLADNTLSGGGLVSVNKGTQTATISVTSAAVVNAASAGLSLGSLTNVNDHVDGGNDFTILIRGAGGNGKFNTGTVYGTGGVVVTRTDSSITIDGSGITGGGGGGGLTAAQVREQVVQMSTGTAGITVTAGGTGASRTIAIALSLASGANPGGIKSGGDLALSGGIATINSGAVTLSKMSMGTGGAADSVRVVGTVGSAASPGALTLSAGTNVSFSRSGTTVTINATGGSGGGIPGVTVTISNMTAGETLVATGTNTMGNGKLSAAGIADGAIIGGNLNVTSVVGSLAADAEALREGTSTTSLVTPAGVVRMLEQTAAAGESWDLTWDADGGLLGANLQTGEIAAEPGNHPFQYNLKASDADETEMDTRFHRNAPIRLETNATNFVQGVILWADHDTDNNIFSFAISPTGRTNAGTLSGSVTVTAQGAQFDGLHANFVTYADITEGGGIGKGARNADGTFPLFVRFADAATVIRGSESARAVSPASLASWDMREQLRITLDGYTARTNATNMPAGSFFADTTNERLHVQPTSSDRVRLTAAFSDANDNGVGMRASAEGGSNKILSGIVNQVTGGDGTNPFNIRLATPADFAGTLGANTIIYIEGERAYDHRTTGLGDDIVTGRSLKGIDPGDTGALKLLANGSFAEFEKAERDDARKLTDDAKYQTSLTTKYSMEWFFHSWREDAQFSPTTAADDSMGTLTFKGGAPNAQNQSILQIRGNTAITPLLRTALQPARGFTFLSGVNNLRGDILSVTEVAISGSSIPRFQVQVQNHSAGGTLVGSGWLLSVFAEGTEELVDNLPHRSISLDALDGGTSNSGKHLGVSAAGKVVPVDAPSGGGNYTLPVATANTLGGVKGGADGDVNIDADGDITLKDNSVDTAEVADRAITEDKLASGLILTAHRQITRGYFANDGNSPNRNQNLRTTASTRFSTDTQTNDSTWANRMWAVDDGAGAAKLGFDRMRNATGISGSIGYTGLNVPSSTTWECMLNGQPTVYFGAVGNSATLEVALELGLQYRYRTSGGTWSTWRDCNGSDYTTGGVTYYDHSNFYGSGNDGATAPRMQQDLRSTRSQQLKSVFRHKEALTAKSNGTRWGDQAPAFMIAFDVGGSGSAFPAQNVDYQFRVVWSAGEGGNESNNNNYVRGQVQRIYNYTERFVADRVA